MVGTHVFTPRDSGARSYSWRGPLLERAEKCYGSYGVCVAGVAVAVKCLCGDSKMRLFAPTFIVID